MCNLDFYGRFALFDFDSKSDRPFIHVCLLCATCEDVSNDKIMSVWLLCMIVLRGNIKIHH